MRKEEIRGLIVYSLLIVAAIIVGLAVIKPTMETYGPSKMSSILFIIIVLVVAYLFNVIGLEILHVIGAVLGGYKVTSFNVLGLCFHKEKDKWKFGLREFNGVSGETKVAPKKEKLYPNRMPALAFFGFAAELAICIVINSIIKGQAKPTAKWLVAASSIFILVSSLLAFYNFIPVKLDSMTDGYKVKLFTKPVNVEAYNAMLTVQEKKRLGESVGNIPVFEEITEYTAEINMLAMYQCLEDEKYEEAEKILDKLLKNLKVLSPKDGNRLIAQKLYLAILTKPLEEAKKLYDEICPTEIRRFISNDVSMPSIRAYIMIAGMIESSESEVIFAKSKVEKAKKRALASEIKAEEILLEKALKYVYENHPKWSKENAPE